MSAMADRMTMAAMTAALFPSGGGHVPLPAPVLLAPPPPWYEERPSLPPLASERAAYLDLLDTPGGCLLVRHLCVVGALAPGVFRGKRPAATLATVQRDLVRLEELRRTSPGRAAYRNQSWCARAGVSSRAGRLAVAEAFVLRRDERARSRTGSAAEQARAALPALARRYEATRQAVLCDAGRLYGDHDRVAARRAALTTAILELSRALGAVSLAVLLGVAADSADDPDPLCRLAAEALIPAPTTA